LELAYQLWIGAGSSKWQTTQFRLPDGELFRRLIN
jgi:hypothetical protein